MCCAYWFCCLHYLLFSQKKFLKQLIQPCNGTMDVKQDAPLLLRLGEVDISFSIVGGLSFHILLLNANSVGEGI